MTERLTIFFKAMPKCGFTPGPGKKECAFQMAHLYTGCSPVQGCPEPKAKPFVTELNQRAGTGSDLRGGNNTPTPEICSVFGGDQGGGGKSVPLSSRSQWDNPETNTPGLAGAFYVTQKLWSDFFLMNDTILHKVGGWEEPLHVSTKEHK